MTFIPNVYGVITTNNSTSTPLGISGTFTGTGEDISDYNTVGVSVFTDQDSATAGLQIQFSSNNTNWDINNNYKIFANQGEYHAVQVKARYCRIVYTNGGVAQTTFRLQTIYGNGNKLVNFKSSG